MTNLYGVMNESNKDEVFTYEANDPEEAARLYLDDPEYVGTVVRVFLLGRHSPAYVKAKNGDVLLIEGPEAVKK